MTRPYSWVIRIAVLGLAVYCVYALLQSPTYHHHRRALWDVYAALVYYMEDNGRFPESAAELLACGFVMSQDDGSFVVQERTESNYAPHTYREPISDLNAFGIRWGTDLATLRVQDEVVVLNEDGNRVLLIDYSPFGLSREYTSTLVKVYQELNKEDK